MYYRNARNLQKSAFWSLIQKNAELVLEYLYEEISVNSIYTPIIKKDLQCYILKIEVSSSQTNVKLTPSVDLIHDMA